MAKRNDKNQRVKSRKKTKNQRWKDKNAQKRGRGRPTKYKSSLVEDAYTYIGECNDKYTQLTKTTLPDDEGILAIVKKGGGVKVENILKVTLPTIEGFALRLGVNDSTLVRWGDKYPDFCAALEAIKKEQKVRLINGGLSNAYNSGFAKFLCSANHGMHETIKTENKEVDPTAFDFELKEPAIYRDPDKRERWQ